MAQSKLSFFLVILMLISVITFVAQLDAQEMSTEGKRAMVQEFVKMAQEYVKQNKIEEAIEIYERIAKAVPEDFEYRAELATLYSRINQHEKAAQIWSELLETDPENIKYQDKLVNSLQAAGKRNEALELLQAYIQTYPEVGIHYARLAKLYADEDNVDAAIANYEKAIELAYGDKQTYLKLAELYFVNDNIDAAEKALKNAILHTTSERDRQSIERQLINLYRYHGNLEEMLQKAEAEGTITFEMQKERARLLLNNGELKKSADAFKKAFEMTNSSYERNRVAEELLKAYLKQDRTDLALEFCKVEASKHPRLVTHMTSYGMSGITVKFVGDDTRKTLIDAYKNQGNLEELRTFFEGKLEKDADNPAIIEMLAEIYWETNDYQKAAEAYRMLSKVEPGNVHSFYYAAAAFHKSNQPDMVKTVLNQADSALTTSSKFKRDSSFLGAIATICLESEMYDPAIKLADAAVTKEESKDNSWGLEYFYAILAKSYHGAKRYEEAFAAYQQVANVTDSSYARGRAETGMNETAKAGKLHEKWIPEQLKKVEENPNDPEPILKLAESYEATNKFKKAIAQYERLAELQPDKPKWHKKLGVLYQNLPPERRETGKVVEGTALTLGGNGSFVEIGDSESLNNITDKVTVSAWIKPTSYPHSYVRIIFRSDEQVQDNKKRSYILVIRRDGKLKITSSPNGEGYASLYSAPGLIKLNKWNHVAGVIDAKNNFIKIFLDGIQVGHRNYHGKDRFYQCRLPLRIGATHRIDEVEKSSFIGQIDEVRVWNVARTVDEIRSDMNTQLNGDEPGLVGYWKFDAETEGVVHDATSNKNDGKLVGNATLEPYTRPVFESLENENFAKVKSLYEKAIELEPTSYQSYDLLAKFLLKSNLKLDAEALYRRALDVPLSQGNHNSAIRAISELYAGEEQADKRIAILEEIKPKMEGSVVLHELLGDLYKKVGSPEKAELANAKWLKIRQKEVNKQSAYYQHRFVDELLNKGLFPETALKLAKRAFHKNTGSGYDYSATLGHACIANGLYDEALKNYKYVLSVIPSDYYMDQFWKEVSEIGKRANDKERYIQMLEALMNTIPPANSTTRANVYRVMAEFYRDNETIEYVENFLLSKIGFVPETCWITIGPFKNRDSSGVLYAYIPEQTAQIDTTAKYYGRDKDKLISWEKPSDNKLDGHFDFGNDNGINNDSAAYAWAIVISPDERDVVIRFDSDDQGTVWLNGEKVFEHHRTSGTEIDRYTIPVTLKQGENTILVKVCNSTQTWDFYLRLTDADGNPFEDLKFKTAEELLNAPPPEPTFHVNANLGMAEYYSKNNMPDKAMEEMRQTGIIHENVWLILGTFDNTDGIGYNTAYIPEDTTQIDLTAKYEGVGEQISWKKFTDDAFDGYIDFGKDINWRVSYAWTTVTSPDEREVQFRFGSDDQGKIWLNGKEVFANPNGGLVEIDRDTIPVTLKAGKNTILVKVCNGELSWGFYFRMTDADGKSFEDLQINDVPDN